LGRNGSGKSTLLQIIFGSIDAENKYVRINDRIIPGISQGKRQIAYLPQHNFLPAHLKIKRMINLFCSGATLEAVTNHYHIKPHLHKKAHQLSGGERRTIEIMLILHSGAKYILVDEPFNAIEPIHKEHIKQLLQEHSKCKGIIVTDHDYTNVLAIASRTILLVDGCTKEIKRKEDLMLWNYLSHIG
jgi:ABC-type multidrug transport system ATPase subunit